VAEGLCVMFRRHWALAFPVVLLAACAAPAVEQPHGDGAVNVPGRTLRFPEKFYESIAVEVHKRLKDGGPEHGCGTVGFELDDEGRPSNFKVFFSAPDARFAQKEIDALSTVQFPSFDGPRRLGIAMTRPGPDTTNGWPVECDKKEFNQAGRQAVSEGYSDQWVVEGSK
jgi:hypothetical protein